VELSQVSQVKQERLSHIDFRVCFLGEINRTNLVSRFGIKEAAATRDIATYRELVPNNLVYDTKAKIYQRSVRFKPLFQYTPTQALAALSQGFGEDFVGQHHPMVASEVPATLNTPLLPVLAELTRAIHQGKAVRIHYHSIESGPSHREIVPFVLVDNGLRWHVRGYCRKRQAFVDFVITRITKPKLIEGELQPHELAQADEQWNNRVQLELVPHPKLAYPETIALDYAMTNGLLKVNVRAAAAGYVLRKWNVDCTETHNLQGSEYHLWLRNKATLRGVENLVLAPGHREHEGVLRGDGSSLVSCCTGVQHTVDEIHGDYCG